MENENPMRTKSPAEYGPLDSQSAPVTTTIPAREQRLERVIGCLKKALDHEFPNRLVALHGTIRMLEAEESPRMSAEGRELFVMLKDSAALLDRIVVSLAELTRTIHTTPATPANATTELPELLDELIPFLRAMFPGVIITYEQQNGGREQNLPLPRPQARTALFHLLRNACRAVEIGSRWKSPTDPPQVRVSLERQENLTILTVADNGAGISEQQLRRLPTPFLGSENGTGIGLFLVREIVEAWGGTLQIESTAGSGTKVRVSF